MTLRSDEIQKNASKEYASLKKAMLDGNTQKADEIKAKMKEMGRNISNMEAGVAELRAMGDTEDQVFTYNMTDGNVGGTDIQNSVITMDIVGNGSMSNGIHESSHGYDLWKNGRPTEKTAVAGEIKAYGRQFSYDKSSLPISDFGRANSLSDINHRWVLGINHGGSYLYINFTYPGRDPKDILRRIK